MAANVFEIMMDHIPPLNIDETVGVPGEIANGIGWTNRWLRASVAALPAPSRLMSVGYSLADQAFAVGATFLANVMLARTQTQEEYGMFALSYTAFTFFAALHNSAVIEPYTVYGSGRYRNRFPDYLRLMVKVNGFVGLALSVLVLLACLVLNYAAPELLSRTLLGLGLTTSILLSGIFLRRVFYIQRKPGFAAQASFICFVTAACALWLLTRAHFLNGFSVFLILALGWIVAGLGVGRKLALGHPRQSFLDSEPGYWQEHWKYSKWVFSTAFVFQLTSQGYYWIVAGLVSVKDVAGLRVMQMLVAPMDQVLAAASFLVVPALAARYASNRMRSFQSFTRGYGLAIVTLNAVFALFVRFAGKPVMHWLYAGKFDELVPTLYILALLPLIVGFGNALDCALRAAEKPKFVFYAFACSGTATLFGGIPLVNHFGLRGAVYGLLLSATAHDAALVFGFMINSRRQPSLVSPAQLFED